MENHPERILVYGLQSSGASWITWMLGQRQQWIVVPDLLSYVPTVEDFADAMPKVAGIIVKTVVQVGETLQDHQARFRPHRTILVERDEEENVISLTKRKRQNIDEKLAIWNAVRRDPSIYDDVIEYETFEPLPVMRSLQDVEDFNVSVSRWCREGRRRIHADRRLWGFGGIKQLRWQRVPGKLSKDEGELLSDLADNKTCLEIGSLFGRSTICMAQVAKHVHAVDPHRPGNSDFRLEYSGRDTLTELRCNLRAANVDRRVVLHIGTVADLWLPAQPVFEFAFIDGSHRTPDVLADLRFVAQCLTVGGCIACHDHSENHLGVVKAVADFGWAVEKQVASLAVLRPKE